MNDLDGLFSRLAKSRFRSGFNLKGKELEYLRANGLPVIMEHAASFIDERLVPADLPNDGKQTPMRNHPVFIAQHATATCCRKCLQKWHGIPSSGHTLDPDEKAYVLRVIEKWLTV
jgi:uncharacterized protein DUF4186